MSFHYHVRYSWRHAFVTICTRVQYNTIYFYNYILYYTIIQSGIYNAAARPNRSIARIESNCIPPTLQTVLQSPRPASLLPPRIAQSLKGRRVLCIYPMIDPPCELHSTLDSLCITFFYKTESREPSRICQTVKTNTNPFSRYSLSRCNTNT